MRDIRRHRRRHLPERYKVAKKVNEKQNYIEHKAFDEKFYIQCILEYICVKDRLAKPIFFHF